MMILKLGTLKQLEVQADRILKPVAVHFASSVRILDETYGADRDLDEDDGGYFLLFDTVEDLQDIADNEGIDFSYHVPEWVDRIETDEGDYGAALYLLSNDFGIVLVAPLELLSTLPDIQECLVSTPRRRRAHSVSSSFFVSAACVRSCAVTHLRISQLRNTGILRSYPSIALNGHVDKMGQQQFDLYGEGFFIIRRRQICIQ